MRSVPAPPRGTAADNLFAEGEAPTPAVAVPRLTLTWPRALVLAILLLAVAGGRAAAFLVVLLGLVWLAATRVVAAGSQGLGLRYRLIDTHAFAGTHARVEVTVGNRSRWPVPLVVLEARLPEGLHGRFRRILTLGPAGLRRFGFEVTAIRRGAYRLGHTRVLVGDWLGLCEQRAQIAARDRLVVYPKIPELPPEALERRLPSGPRRDVISPFRDDLPAGVRPYLPGDPLRAIAWKQSARRGELVVREYPRVREAATWVFLDLYTPDWDARSRHEGAELAVSVAAGLLWEEYRAGRAAGLAAWGGFSEHTIYGEETTAPASWNRLAPAAGHGRPLQAMELLATIRPGETIGMPDFATHLRRDLGHLPWGARALVLVPRDTPDLWRICAEARAKGHPVTVLCIERRLGRPPGLAGPYVPDVWEVRSDGAIRFD